MLTSFSFTKQALLKVIRKNDALYKFVKKARGKQAKRALAPKHNAPSPALVKKRTVISGAKELEQFYYKFRLRNYFSAVDILNKIPPSSFNAKQRLDAIHCMLSANRGVEADIILRSALKELKNNNFDLSYIMSVADKVLLSGFRYSEKKEILEGLKFNLNAGDGGARLVRHLNWLDFRLRNARESNIDPLQYIDSDSEDVAVLQDSVRYLSALKTYGHSDIIKKILFRLYEKTKFDDIVTLRAFLTHWPEWFKSEQLLGNFPDKFKNDSSFLVALHGAQGQSSEIKSLYEQCLDTHKRNYRDMNVLQKDKLLRVMLRLDLLEIVQELVFSDNLPGEVLPVFIAQGFKYFEEDDFHSARSCFMAVLKEDPADGMASSGLRLAYPRTGHDMRAILTFRDNIGYGINSAGRAGLQAVGSELTIAELMSGNYIAGLYSKRKSAHWLVMEDFYGPKFLNYRRLPSSASGNETLFLIGDEGVGDEIRTAQFYEALTSMFRSVTVSCDPRLFNIFSKSYPDIRFIPVRRFRKGVAEPGEVEDARLTGFGEKISSYLTEECRDYINSADYITFGQNLFFDHFIGGLPRPSKGPYLNWLKAKSIEPNKKIRVGLLWRSHFKSRMRDYMYLSLEDFLPLTELSGVEFWSIQHCIDEQEIQLCHEYGIKLSEGIDLFNDFEGLSGFLQNMDLLIGISSVPIELGAAFGVDVWMLGFSPENYYLRTSGGKNMFDRYTMNSTVIAPPWIDFSEPRDECVRQVFGEVRRRLNDKIASWQA